MTTKVKITHAQPNYEKKVKVTVLDKNYETGRWKKNVHQSTVLSSEESVEIYVYDSRKIEISEA